MIVNDRSGIEEMTYFGDTDPEIDHVRPFRDFLGLEDRRLDPGSNSVMRRNECVQVFRNLVVRRTRLSFDPIEAFLGIDLAIQLVIVQTKVFSHYGWVHLREFPFHAFGSFPLHRGFSGFI